MSAMLANDTITLHVCSRYSVGGAIRTVYRFSIISESNGAAVKK
jgi:hypothetical protein